ncbi:MAG: hypothetical protein ABFC88_12750 [Thermoguttaceae bacterium]
MAIEHVKFTVRTSSGTLIRKPLVLERKGGRIYFWDEQMKKSPWGFKDEIKSMAGSHFHGYDDEGEYAKKMVWSVDDCQRNNFQLSFLMGEDVYAWFDRPVTRHEYRPLYRNGVLQEYMPHQADLSDGGLTYHYQIFGAEMGTGKTLAAQMVMEKAGKPLWWWVGPKTSLPNIKRELKMWGFPFHEIQVEFMTYEALVRVMDEWDGSQPLPFGVIFDESSRCKNCTSQRSRAANKLADLIRAAYGLQNGYVIEMSGTPSPKSPVDWWSQCEIAWPGFLKEGSPKAMEERLAFMVEQQYDAGPFKKRISWRDDESKCEVCGELRDEGPHSLADCDDPDDYHPFKASNNEVSYLYERLKGLVIIKHKKDCLKLPDKRYRRIVCKPTPSVMRVAQAIANAAPNAVTGMTLLRELSDGFQYREIEDGVSRCTHCKDGTVEEWSDPDNPDKTYSAIDMLDPALVERLVKQVVPCPVCGGSQEVAKIVRVAREVPCPKEAALKMLLEENEETGRLVVFAGFTGSVDRVVKLCLREKWDVVRCDQGNFQVFAATSDSHEGQLVTSEEPLDYWANLNDHSKVAFVANPESGGMSLTLVEARMAVYWSNSWKPEYRVQSEDRIHRKGMDLNLGCTIVDLIHLPNDERVLNVLRDNRRIELLTMGEVMADVNWNDVSDDGEMLIEEAA